MTEAREPMSPEAVEELRKLAVEAGDDFLVLAVEEIQFLHEQLSKQRVSKWCPSCGMTREERPLPECAWHLHHDHWFKGVTDG